MALSLFLSTFFLLLQQYFAITTTGFTMSTVSSQKRVQKVLPKKILVAYTTNNCSDLNDMSKVTKAIEDGVNVLIWCFLSFENIESSDQQTTLKIKSGQQIDNYKAYRNQLSQLGFDSIIHLVSFGGWNGKHLPSGYSGIDLYKIFKEFNDQKYDGKYTTDSSGTDSNEQQYELHELWDGIDWDIEGHDDIHSPQNEFTTELLNQMGTFSVEAKKDGLITSMAPPESYLDTTTSRFSRFVNLTYPNDDWNQDFKYHGWNVYAYVMAKYGQAIDFVMIQFYESYSHALYQTQQLNMTQSDFLVKYIQHLSYNTFGYIVNFEDDQTIDIQNQFVPLPLEKLVFGFANGWALDLEKAIFFNPSQVKIAFDHLRRLNLEPRGCGFWVVEEEGKHEVELAKELKNAIIHDFDSERNKNMLLQ